MGQVKGEYGRTYEQKRKFRRSVLIIPIIVLLFVSGLFWLGCAAYLEVEDLIRNGKEVTAIVDRISEDSSTVKSGGIERKKFMVIICIIIIMMGMERFIKEILIYIFVMSRWR